MRRNGVYAQITLIPGHPETEKILELLNSGGARFASAGWGEVDKSGVVSNFSLAGVSLVADIRL